MRSCADEPGFPLYAVQNPEVQVPDCYDNCFRKDATCPATSVTKELQFAVSIAIDALEGGERESRGRLMFVTVATYDKKPRRRLAVCPSVVFDSPNTNDFLAMNYGVEQTPQDSCNVAASFDGEPRCGNIVPIPLYWSISLAREQEYAPSCGKHTGGGDQFSTPALLKCGNAAPHFETYEVALRNVDALLDPADRLSALPNADIIRRLNSVRLDIFEDIGALPLHCASGVNINRYASHPGVATMSTQSLVKGASTFNLGMTDRQ